MRVKVRALRRQGVVMPQQVANTQPPVVGELEVVERRNAQLGRAVTLARLLDNKATATDVLPELMDARLLWAQDRSMRLTGTERVGDAEYAQTWAVELL